MAGFQALLGVPATPFRNLLPSTLAARLFLLFFLAFSVWTVTSTIWSPVTDHGQAWRFGGGVVCGLLFAAGAASTQANRRLTRAAALAGLVVLSVLLIIEAVGDMPLNRMDQPTAETGVLARNPGRGATVLVCLVWAAVAALAGGNTLQRYAWRGLIFVAAALSVQFDMAVNAIALGAGLIAFAIGRTAPRFAILALCGGLAAWLLAAPFVTPLLLRDPALLAQLPDSWAIRAEIWRFVCEHIQADPWIGMGLDGARTFEETSTLRGIEFSLVPLHPHSGTLQIWLETGAVGAGLGALALLAGGWALSQRAVEDRAFAAAAAACIAAIGVTANVSYGAWQEWWVATAFAAAALVASVRRADDQRAS